MRVELDFHSAGDMNPACSLCTFGRGPGSRPCSVTQVSNSGLGGGYMESQSPGREPDQLCLLTVRAPSCCLATKDVSCQRCRDGIGWGIYFLLGHQPA